MRTTLAIVLLNALCGPALAGDARPVPSCENDVIQTMVKQAVEKSPSGKLLGLTVFAIREIENIADSANKQRCSAMIFTSGGRQRVSFTIEWMDGDNIWIEIVP